MKVFPLALLAAACACAHANEQETQRAIQRALIERDQQSAEFAAQVRGGPGARRELEALHERQRMDAGRPLHPDPTVARDLQGYERSRMAEERGYVLSLPPPRELRDPTPRREAPLPLPGGPRHNVEPIPPTGFGG